MSTFSVSSTQDKGYIATNASTVFKTNESLLEIPNAITVVTRDMITDIGSGKSSDVLQYAGVSNFFRGDSYALRGGRLGYALVDELPDVAQFADNIYVDSYEVIRGPAAVLYPTAVVGGLVLKTSRKPMSVAMHSASVRLDQYGLYRLELDSTGPVKQWGSAHLNYRVLGAYQDGDTYFKNVKDKVSAIHPSLQFVNNQTRVLLAFDAQRIEKPVFSKGLMQPNGELYTGAGRDEVNLDRGSNARFDLFNTRFQVQHSFSADWEMKTFLMQSFKRSTVTFLNTTAVDFTNNLVSYNAARGGDKFNDVSALLDFSGRYTLFGVENRSLVGFNIQNRVTIAPNGTTTKTRAWLNRALNAPHIETIDVPALSDYTEATGGSINESQNAAIYVQQTVHVVPERFSLVGGLTVRDLYANSAADRWVVPRVFTNSRLNKLVHRYGAVFQVIKGQVSVFAMESTTADPASTTQRDANGQLLPAPEGKGKEVGIKTNLADGRLTSTLTFYDIVRTNQSVFTGVGSGTTAVFAPIGSTKQRGWDADFAFRIFPNWQVVGTIYSGSVKDQTGAPVANAYDRSWSLFTRYDFDASNLKGLSIGGGAARISGRQVSTGGIVFPAGQALTLIKMKAGTMVTAFASYRFSKQWSARLSVDNVLDEVYAMGAQSAVFIDPSPPRSFAVSVRYDF